MTQLTIIGARLFMFFTILASVVFFVQPANAQDRAAAYSDRTSPEVGFGDKSEAAILKEKIRDNKIGVLGDMSGELRMFGEEAAHGAELAADEINANGGIRGKEFDLLIFDTAGSVAGARQGVDVFIRHKAVAVVGAATSEVSFAANKMINDNQLPLVSSGSRRRLGDTGPYNFRNALTDSDGVAALIEYISTNRKWKRFGLISSVVNDYSIQLNAVFKAELLKRKMEISHELYIWSHGMDRILPEERGMEPQLKQMIDNPPDVVVFTGGDAEGVELVNAMWKMNLKMPVIGSEDLMTETFAELGPQAVGAMLFSGFDAQSKKKRTRKFIRNYTKRYGAEPTRLAALAYDSYYLIAKGLEKAKSMRPSHVRKAMMDIQNYNGVTGVTSIGATREAEKEPFLFEFRKKGNGYGFVNIKERK